MRNTFTSLALAAAAYAQEQTYTFENQTDPGLYRDPLTAGPSPELIHLYNDQWPTGVAVSRNGRIFSNYPRALDPNNTEYTVAELFANNTERAYPNATYNLPPSGLVDNSTGTPMSVGNASHLTGVQSVVIDGANRLWILDTGRTAISDGTILPASPGGAKLVGVDLDTDQIFTTIVFDSKAAPAASYLNDMRFDLSSNLTKSGQGVAYITDSSPEGQNAIVVVDLGTGEAWRRLVLHPSVQANAGFVPTIAGYPVYINQTGDETATNVNFGADGIALSADNSELYYATTGGRELFSVPTKNLLDRSRNAELKARGAVQYHGETGLKDGMDTDTNGMIYAGNIEDNAVAYFDPATGLLNTLVRDPRFVWTDCVYSGFDGYLYFTQNQLWRRPQHWFGEERRVMPYALFRVPLPNGGTKIEQDAPSS
ncbi:uncharacterized protein MYCGRDRAFT_108740 [Zymoseptoria tritici IPO323]|uniref:Major royal jelly protein n=1 Tax=Zymoseptoria tritici (strain CBS 115943 / IPO323) TaxID=336722 RepID=F9X7W1_ZYMTI|nr:uncharacterized protein MYCGRDRAFT_108740 [Zymoseptoria tritici IPO323]EGP88944.1 hypothetical protein MYCGRDRAFT_108740 [Zymoseptoria tritici IPO323]